jgi:uncharacterized membrane protein
MSASAHERAFYLRSAVPRIGTSSDTELSATVAAGQGTNADFMCGLSLGFFLGIIMIFMLWELRMSRQQRMGVIMGILMNGLFAVFRQNVRQMHAAEIIPQQ